MEELIAYRDISLESLNAMGKGTLAETLGMEVVELGPDFVVMEMKVVSGLFQPMGLLHGGAVAALAENVGSLAAHLVVGRNKGAVGLSLSCNHLKSVRSGTLRATARPIHIGRTTHLWSVETRDQEGKLINDCRLTMAIIDTK